MIFSFLFVFGAIAALCLIILHFFWLIEGGPKSSQFPQGCLFLISLPFLLMATMWFFFGWLFAPYSPRQSDIIGEYRIDRDFHSGPQADWQNETYQMEITADEVRVTDQRTDTIWRYSISWDSFIDYQWSFSSDDSRHHMVQGEPAIVREPFGHYYIFQSPLYGDVVFRKKEESRWGLWLFFFLVGAAVLLWKSLRDHRFPAI